MRAVLFVMVLFGFALCADAAGCHSLSCHLREWYDRHCPLESLRCADGHCAPPWSGCGVTTVTSVAGCPKGSIRCPDGSCAAFGMQGCGGSNVNVGAAPSGHGSSHHNEGFSGSGYSSQGRPDQGSSRRGDAPSGHGSSHHNEGFSGSGYSSQGRPDQGSSRRGDAPSAHGSSHHNEGFSGSGYSSQGHTDDDGSVQHACKKGAWMCPDGSCVSALSSCKRNSLQVKTKALLMPPARCPATQAACGRGCIPAWACCNCAHTVVAARRCDASKHMYYCKRQGTCIHASQKHC